MFIVIVPTIDREERFYKDLLQAEFPSLNKLGSFFFC